MNSVDGFAAIQKFMRTTQIVLFALTLGPAVFLGVVAFLVLQGAKPSGTPGVTYILAGIALITLIARSVVLKLLIKNERRRIADGTWTLPPTAAGDEGIRAAGDVGALMLLYQKQSIVGSALIESAAFMMAMAYLLEQSPLALTWAILFVISLALQIPSSAKIKAWIETQYALLESERSAQQVLK